MRLKKDIFVFYESAQRRSNTIGNNHFSTFTVESEYSYVFQLNNIKKFVSQIMKKYRKHLQVLPNCVF